MEKTNTPLNKELFKKLTELTLFYVFYNMNLEKEQFWAVEEL